MSNLRHLPAAAFQRGDLVTYHGMPCVIVFVKDGYADLAPGDDLAKVSAMGRVLTAVKLLARREPATFHFVTIEPISEDERDHYAPAWDDDPIVPPRLCIAEHRPGQPTTYHGTEGWVPLGRMRERALAVAVRVGAFYIEPVDALAIELLRGVNA